MTALPKPLADADVFDVCPDPAAFLAADGALLRANSAYLAVFPHALNARRPPWGRVTPPDFVADERRFDAPAPDGRVFQWAERILPDGARFVIARDITSHARASEEALRAKTALFARLTHELRTPLNGVLGLAGLLAQHDLEPSAQSYLAAIRESGELLLDLITEILDYSRLEAGRLTLETTPFEPECALQSVAELLSPKAHAKGLDIAVLVYANVPHKVLGDDGRLRQILFNLAGNAVKFTETGAVTLECQAIGPARLRFTVRDTGPGVAPDKQSLIFEEFAQADASISARYGGAGLGLSIVKKLAQAMGGEAGLVSRPGEGASFWVDLPFPAAPGEAPSLSLDAVRCAIICDSRPLERALSIMMTELGAKLVGLEDAPDVVLLDCAEAPWPDEAARLRQNARAVIALIAQEERAAIDRCRAAGIAHYSLKPLRRASLVERIRIALGAAPSAAAPVDQRARPPELDLAGLRTLVAEDNPINALLARTMLSRAGAIVDVVGDGVEALAAAAIAPYDLIFLDLRMPRLDGVAAAVRIRDLPGPAGQTPIIALTADVGADERARALAAGMDDFLTKPINPAHLANVAARFTRARKPANT